MRLHRLFYSFAFSPILKKLCPQFFSRLVDKVCGSYVKYCLGTDLALGGKSVRRSCISDDNTCGKLGV